MNPNGYAVEQGEVYGRVWRFANCEFDETRRELRVEGRLLELEAKPLDILSQLLMKSGEVVTRDELMEAVWPGVQVVESSLATAVSKLRKALGEDSGSVIVTVPRVGYRLGVPSQSRRMAPPPFPELNLKAGDAVPGRDQWQLVRNLDVSAASEVWIASHPRTLEKRVFKFAADGVRLRGLKREVTLARLLKSSLGECPEFVRLFEWNFDSAPYYLESEYSGPNLLGWADEQGGLAGIALEDRLAVLVSIARAVAAAHGVGVLHKDLKPANVLMMPRAEGGGWQVKVADFGSGSLADPHHLNALGITNLGFTQQGTNAADLLTGTLMYMAPEVLAGQSPTVRADVYALGVLLYQMAIGDFRRPLAAGWEADIEDALLREDIADAACGDAKRRMASALVLAERLERREARRSERTELELQRNRTQVAEQRLAHAKARLPWLVFALGTLAAGLLVSVAFYLKAAQERDRANHQTAITASMNQFLANDLLGRGNPFQSGNNPESLVDALKGASAGIDDKFRNEPEVAARLHQAVARALDNRTVYKDARPQYELAARLFRKNGGPLSEDAIAADLQRVSMEARTYEQGSLPRAQALLKQQEERLAQIPSPRPDLRVWHAAAQGMVRLIDNDAKGAADRFAEAYKLAASLDSFDENARLTLQQRLAFSYIRSGEGARAEKLFRELIAAFTRLQGAESPNVLRVRLNLAQAYMIEGKHKEAVQETTAIYPSYLTKLGEEHELSMQVLTTRAQSEGSLEAWDAAVTDDLKIHEIAVRKQGPLSFFAIATLSDAALAQCRSHRVPEGVANARRAYDASLKAFGVRAGLTGGVAHTLATCEIEAGRLSEAATLLDSINSPAVAQLAGIKDWSANVDFARADIAFRKGDLPAARKHLSLAAPAFLSEHAEPFQKRAAQTLQAALDDGMRPRYSK